MCFIVGLEHDVKQEINAKELKSATKQIDNERIIIKD